MKTLHTEINKVANTKPSKTEDITERQSENKKQGQARNPKTKEVGTLQVMVQAYPTISYGYFSFMWQACIQRRGLQA